MGVEQAAFADWYEDFQRVFGPGPMHKVTAAAGQGAIKSARPAASGALGGDMRLSGFPKAKLSIKLTPVRRGGRTISLELDSTGPVTPQGIWGLANTGRKKSGPIYPRRQKGTVQKSFGKGKSKGPIPNRAVKLPDGQLRRYSNYGPQRKRPMAKDKAEAAARFAGPVAARRQFLKETRKVLAKPNVYRYRMA